MPRLESLRGIAAVAVVGYHSYSTHFDTATTGMAPVIVFFVLSGFVLARSLENNPSPLAFFRNRVFRLLPAASFVVLLLAALYWQFGFFIGHRAPFDALNIALNALMIRNDINGVMWSLTVECLAAPLILASVATFERFGPAPLVALCVMLSALSFWGPYVHLLGGFTNLAPFYAFVVGVLLHFQTRKAQQYRFGTAIAICAAIVMIACGLRQQAAAIMLAECLSSGALIFSIAIRPDSNLFKPLDLSLVHFYGRISYSFYLFHPIGLVLALKTVSTSELNSSVALIFLLTMIYTTPMAWLSWRAIEKPFMRLGRAKHPDDKIAIDGRPHDRDGSPGPTLRRAGESRA